MRKKKHTEQKPEEKIEMVNEPSVAYGVVADLEKKRTPVNCSLEELNILLDKAEENINNGHSVSHQEALKEIYQW